MPDLDALSKSFGLPIALLLSAVIALVGAVMALWRKNEALWGRIEAILSERAKLADVLLQQEGLGGRRDRP